MSKKSQRYENVATQVTYDLRSHTQLNANVLEYLNHNRDSSDAILYV